MECKARYLEAAPEYLPLPNSLAKAEVDSGSNKAPANHPKFLHAIRELEELRRKSVLELPLSIQADRLKQSIKDDADIIHRMKSDVRQQENLIDQKCDDTIQWGEEINV